MGCENCTSGSGGVPRGCGNNGTCSSGGCSKLAVYDWLANIELPGGKRPFDIVEVRFKNNRKSFFRNADKLDLYSGDAIVVEGNPGHDVGVVSASGELARIQVERKNPGYKPLELKKILRKATQQDIDKWREARDMEEDTMHKARLLAADHKLDMKISDVEYQGDKSKATFYYTADGRVDFRELIKSMADAFRVRIEMRQIGARQEAGRLGGIGSCGRELCCSTWLTDFRSVSTNAARYQQLSINPQKLAGQCGKLKCCLNFELDQYVEALKEFPSSNVTLETRKGKAYHQKTDIFKGLMWYSYADPKEGDMIPLKVKRVKEIIDLNKGGKSPDDLKDFSFSEPVVAAPDFENVVGQDSLDRFDKQFKKKKKKRKTKSGQGRRNDGQQQGNQGNQGPKGEQKGNKGGKRRKPRRKKE